MGRENCLEHHNEAEITLVSYMLKFAETDEACVLMEKWNRSVLDIKTMLVIALRVKWQSMSQCDTISFPCGKGEVPAIKIHQYSCTR